MPFLPRILRLHAAAGLGALLVWLAGAAPAGAGTDSPRLARIDVPGPRSSFPLPVHAQLRDAAGQDYVLVVAAAGDLEASGWNFQILDDDATGD